jgi:hypothetical protein
MRCVSVALAVFAMLLGGTEASAAARDGALLRQPKLGVWMCGDFAPYVGPHAYVYPPDWCVDVSPTEALKLRLLLDWIEMQRVYAQRDADIMPSGPDAARFMGAFEDFGQMRAMLAGLDGSIETECSSPRTCIAFDREEEMLLRRPSYVPIKNAFLASRCPEGDEARSRVEEAVECHGKAIELVHKMHEAYERYKQLSEPHFEKAPKLSKTPWFEQEGLAQGELAEEDEFFEIVRALSRLHGLP